MIKSIVIVLLALFMIPTQGYCGASSFGELADAEISVRANGMANACVAKDGDVFGVYYNPAITTDGRQLGMIFQRGYSDDSTGGIAISFPKFACSRISAGISALYYTASAIDLYTTDNVLKRVDAEKDYLVTASLSSTFGMVSVGGSAKLLNTRLFDAVQGTALMCDAGIIVRNRPLTIGFAVQNMGGRMMLGDEAESVPVTYRAGVSRDFIVVGLKTNGAVDCVKTGEELPCARIGLEFMNNTSIAFRAGYEYDRGRSLSNIDGICVGISIPFDVITVDYAFVPYQLLGDTHRISVIYHY